MDVSIGLTIFVGIAAAVVSVLLVPLIRRLALATGAVSPESDGHVKRLHRHDRPRLGGLAVFAAFVVVVVALTVSRPEFIQGLLTAKHLIGIMIAAGILMIGGFIDDKYDILPRWQFVFPVAAVLVIVAAGISVQTISNPIGPDLVLNNVQWELFRVNDVPYHITPLADLFTFAWLMGMMYTLKYLDGVDGVTAGVTVIAMVTITLLSLTVVVMQPEIALLAAIMAGAVLGFLFYNFYPSKIIAGEGGPLFFGLMIGVLAILSGSKIVTTLLVVGIPVLDVAWVISRRIITGASPFKGDRKHLHHRLLDIGLSQRKTAMFYYITSALFAAIALTLHSFGKIVALIALVCIMMVLGATLVVLYKRRHPEELYSK